MSTKNLKVELNKLLGKHSASNDFPSIDEALLNQDCKTIWFDEPFAHIRNFADSLKALKKFPIWLSYGGNRTGSTFVTMTMKILLDSMVESFLIGWEGDFKEPAKFFELLESTPRAFAGILKIHHSEDYCNGLLERNKAKAVVSTRDYPSIAGSYARMKKNPYSPFYSPNKLTDGELIFFISNQIKEHQKKKHLPNTLFAREDIIRKNPHASILSIAKHLGVHLSETSAYFIAEKLNVKSQRTRQKNLIVNSTGHDKDNFLHFEHVNPSDQQYDSYIQDLVFGNFGELLDQDGYLKF